MGAQFVQDDTSAITIKARDKLLNILPISLYYSSKGDQEANSDETTAYRSAMGKLLYVRRLVCPFIAINASHAASKCSSLPLRILRALNSTLKRARNYPAAVTYVPLQRSLLRLEVTTDAAMK